jgi:murein DD-endopeptidase MepM/ murein hydrolase activator NlpD
VAPVDGSVSRGFGAGGDGIDFAAPAGSAVRAAGDGQVALVSESLGGYGTIVLIRHRDSLLTLYGRIEQVTVSKGDRVQRGQQIGVVAPGGDRGDSLHFEVREGVESVDPERYLAG